MRTERFAERLAQKNPPATPPYPLCKHAEIRLFEGHSERPTTGGKSESTNLTGSSANADLGIYRPEGRFC